ncbi:hypothetical protein CPB85DRAFT_1219145, partial [Mucidula mucida]
EISFEDEPVFMALKSTDNIPIKSSWLYFRCFNGPDLRLHIEKGKEEHWFNGPDPLQVKLFNWVWSQIACYEVKRFKTWFNDQPTRTQFANTQHSKLLPSGVAPDVVLDFPERYSLEDCGIPIDHTVIAGLRAILPKT